MPTLFLSVEPGTMTDDDREFIRGWKGVTEVSVNGGHMVTEDCPDEVGRAIAEWFGECVKKGGGATRSPPGADAGNPRLEGI